MSTPRHNLDTYNHGDDNWSHTDTVEFVDEHSIDRGPVSERPTSGNYDDEFYYATDQNVLWSWDESLTDWIIRGGTGSEEQPLDSVVTEQANITNQLQRSGATLSDHANYELVATEDDMEDGEIEVDFKRGTVISAHNQRDGDLLLTFGADGDEDQSHWQLLEANKGSQDFDSGNTEITLLNPSAAASGVWTVISVWTSTRGNIIGNGVERHDNTTSTSYAVRGGSGQGDTIRLFAEDTGSINSAIMVHQPIDEWRV